jgi:hypothetical protein
VCSGLGLEVLGRRHWRALRFGVGAAAAAAGREFSGERQDAESYLLPHCGRTISEGSGDSLLGLRAVWEGRGLGGPSGGRRSPEALGLLARPARPLKSRPLRLCSRHGQEIERTGRLWIVKKVAAGSPGKPERFAVEGL